MQLVNRRKLLTTAAYVTVAAPFLQLKAARAAEFNLKCASEFPTTHPSAIWAAKACDQIREKTGNRVDIKFFPNSQLGSQADTLNQLRLGGIDLLPYSGVLLATMVPLAAINGIPFAFTDYNQVWKAMDGELGAFIRGAIEKSGFVVFDRIWDIGYREVTSGTKPIKTPADLHGFKMRVPGSQLWITLFNALGAQATPLSWNETYTSLQTKIIDGQETPLMTVEAAKLYEVQKYCAMTNHMWDGQWYMANRNSMGRLPPDLRRIVVDTFNAAALNERADLARQNVTVKAELERKGLVFNDVDPGQFREALRKAGFYAEWKKTFGPQAWAVLEKSVGQLA